MLFWKLNTGLAAPWSKCQSLASYRLGPEFTSRSLYMGLVVDKSEFGLIFLGVSPVFPLPHISFDHFSTLISVISFLFMSSAPVMVSQAWWVGILAIHSMDGSPGDVSENPVTQERRNKGWRMSCGVGKAREGLENQL